jgi:hypothetical protein
MKMHRIVDGRHNYRRHFVIRHAVGTYDVYRLRPGSLEARYSRQQRQMDGLPAELSPFPTARNGESSSESNQTALARDVGYALLTGSTNSDKPYLYITQYDSNAFDMFSVNVTSGRLPENDQEIVLPERISMNAGISWKIGDRIELSNGIRMYPDNTEVPKGSYYADI